MFLQYTSLTRCKNNNNWFKTRNPIRFSSLFSINPLTAEFFVTLKLSMWQFAIFWRFRQNGKMRNNALGSAPPGILSRTLQWFTAVPSGLTVRLSIHQSVFRSGCSYVRRSVSSSVDLSVRLSIRQSACRSVFLYVYIWRHDILNSFSLGYSISKTNKCNSTCQGTLKW